MTIFSLNPLEDLRWREFVARHPHSTIFHSVGWLQALQRTYGYNPVVFTTSPPGAELQNGVAFCEVKSWLTGRRIVSLPFSDHCEPLVTNLGDLPPILSYLKNQSSHSKWKYIELRPLSDEMVRNTGAHFKQSDMHHFHKIDLRPAAETIFRGFHDSCVRRKIRKAEREELRYEAGSSELLLQQFHRLLLLTRRRHKLPPQPRAWFRNLMDCLGSALTIRVVSRGDQPVASIITLSHKKSLVYKYGCSDWRFNNLGGTPLLFWKAIQESRELGAEELDLGRSDVRDSGLAAFKEHLGGTPSELYYYRDLLAPARSLGGGEESYIRQAFARMPDPIFSGVGRLLYRHMG